MGEIHPQSQLTLRTSGAITGLAKFCNVSPDEVVAVLSNVVMRNASPAEMIAFAMVARAYDLDPLKREIYAFKNKEGVMMAGLYFDGWITIINRHKDFAGMEIDYKDHPQTGMPHSCTVTIHTKSRPKFPTVVTEYFDECRMAKEHWTKWPRRQLRHKAIIQCARVAFGFAGIGDMQEFQDRDSNLAPIAGTRDRGSSDELRKRPAIAADVVAENGSYTLTGPAASSDRPDWETAEVWDDSVPTPATAAQVPPQATETPASATPEPTRQEPTSAVHMGDEARSNATVRKSKPRKGARGGPGPNEATQPLPLSDDDIQSLLE